MKAGSEISLRAARIEPAMKPPEQSPGEHLKELSHELRTPLNVIIGLCQFLDRDRRDPLQPMQHDAVRRMERNAQALLLSVNQLLERLRQGHRS